MSFTNRVATIATFLSAAAALIGFGTPGMARDISEAVNVPVALSVPASAIQPAVAAAALATGTFTMTTAVPVVAPIPAPIPANVVGVRPGDTVAFGSLAAAVAAQSVPDAMGEDLSCVAGAIYFEAKGEPLSGQLAVAQVIINRAKSGRFPKTVCSVVTQPGQFSFVHGGRIPAVGGNAAYRTAVAVARVALAEAWDNPAPAAMYFHARRAAPRWNRTQVAAIGNHVFYR